jgi:glycosyltransferase involved in cell wall biosynthesis
MVMASTELGKEAERAVPLQSPLLSVIVPVYNGGRKIESTLQKLKTQIEGLEPVLAKLDDSGTKNMSPVYTGRRVIEKAGAAVLLDQYLSTHSQELALEKTNETPIQPLYEIIVVNDGSKDGTRNIVNEISSVDETIRLISYSINMGKGYAIKQGVLHSRGKYVMFLDGDGEISTDVLSKYLEQLSTSDIAIGSKYHRQSIVSVPSSRRFFSKCFHLFVKVMLGTSVSDTQVGLKAGNGDTFRKIFQKVLVKRYAFDAEMLAVADILGVRVVELPVKIDLDKSFKKKEIIKMALDIMGVAFRLRVLRWYQKNMEMQRPSYRALVFA